MKKFKGLITALITPFKNNEIDFSSIEKTVKFQIAQGVDGFVINGTTGESPTLHEDEVLNIFAFVKNIVGDTKFLIVGTGSNSTEKTIASSRQAEKMGADAILVVVPYYNKPPQRGLVEHFNKVANSIAIPTILYNVPGRTVTSLSIESIAELSRNSKIVGIKEASGNIEFAQQIRQACGDEFILLSGDDGTYVDFLLAGGDGVISVTSHVFPKAMKNWENWVKEGSAQQAKEDLQKHLNLINHLFSEANPIPIKFANYLMGLSSTPELRLPLVTFEYGKAEQLQNMMKELGYLS